MSLSPLRDLKPIPIRLRFRSIYNVHILIDIKEHDITQTTLSIRIDDDLKSNFEAICSELGIDVTTAVTMLAKKMDAGKGVVHDLLED